jgi:hypothetical protein
MRGDPAIPCSFANSRMTTAPPRSVALRETIFDPDVAAFDKASVSLVQQAVSGCRTGNSFHEIASSHCLPKAGSKADIARCQADIRFTPKSGH